MSLYADYLRERGHKEIFEEEYGFCMYHLIEAGLFVEDLYIDPEHREQGKAVAMMRKMDDIALVNDKNKVFTQVVPGFKGSEHSLGILLHDGFKLDSADKNFIYLYKELTND